MRSRLGAAFLLAVTLLLAGGCLRQDQDTSIPPLPAAGAEQEGRGGGQGSQGSCGD